MVLYIPTGAGFLPSTVSPTILTWPFWTPASPKKTLESWCWGRQGARTKALVYASLALCNLCLASSSGLGASIGPSHDWWCTQLKITSSETWVFRWVFWRDRIFANPNSHWLETPGICMYVYVYILFICCVIHCMLEYLAAGYHDCGHLK